jgi:hypothetical protein
MPEGFLVNQALLNKAREALGERPRLYCLMGGSCTGKTTVAQRIAGESGVTAVNMDTYIFDRFMPRYSEERHPASKAWFGADNPLAWVMSLSWEAFDSLNRASNAEFLDLLADELEETPNHEALVIDGGFTHPSVLAQVVSPAQIACLEATDEIRYGIWETAEERSAMKGWILDLPDGQAKWQKFLYFDKMIAETMVTESEAAGIAVINRSEETSIDEVAQAVMASFGMVNGEW